MDSVPGNMRVSAIAVSNSLRAAIFAIWAALWATSGLAAADEEWLAQMLEQENLLTELESTRGPTDLSLIEPLQAMVMLLRERSEYERVAALQEHQLELMRINHGPEGAELIPLLKEMVLIGVEAGDREAVSDFLRQLRVVTATQGDPVALLKAIELQAYWHKTGGAGRTHKQRIESFYEAHELFDELEILLDDAFDEGDPAIVPWLYRVYMNKYHLLGLLNSERAVRAVAREELAWREGADALWAVGRATGGASASQTAGRWGGGRFIPEAQETIEKITDVMEAAGDVEAQAMATIYEADFHLLMNWASAWGKYRDARELLRRAGVAEERISLFFSHPQQIPYTRFHPTLEEAIAQQDADLSRWSPGNEDFVHVAQFTAWSESVPNLKSPISENVFWNEDPSYYEAELDININSVGFVPHVDVLAFTPENNDVRFRLRRTAEELRFRPVMEGNRRRRVNDVHIRVLIPRGSVETAEVE